MTTTVGQWVSHDLRLALYQRIQRLSLLEHGESRTGDMISRVTSDIDAIQDFITTALLGIVVQLLTLLGMIGVMFYINWRFTLIALSVAPILFLVVYYYSRRIKKASRAVRRKESEMLSGVAEISVGGVVSVIGLVATSQRTRKYPSGSFKDNSMLRDCPVPVKDCTGCQLKRSMDDSST